MHSTDGVVVDVLLEQTRLRLVQPPSEVLVQLAETEQVTGFWKYYRF